MKLGLGLYRDLLTDENFRFARQAGATHLVVHLVDYFRGPNPCLSSGQDAGWGPAACADPWPVEFLADLKKRIESHGLTWAAVENFDPAQWHDVLLDGPRKAQQLETCKTIVRNLGQVGVPILGYNFSLAGVWGWTKRPTGRGQAISLEFDAHAIDLDQPIPAGMVWNMQYDPDAPQGSVPPVSDEQLWARLRDFLDALVPVAREAGVRLAAHPDDPPVDSLRGAARLVNRPEKYQRLLDLAPSPANAIEMCLGSLQEMPASQDLYDALRRYARQHAIAYVHARNVKGRVPHYRECFIDEGDLDIPRALAILHEEGFDGVIIPDHTPEMSCPAPWHAGMAFALGYLRAQLQHLGIPD